MSKPLKQAGRAACIAAAVSLCAPVTILAEGTRLRPYRDPVGIWTVCDGETKVAMHLYTPSQCAVFLKAHLANTYAPIVLKCAPKLSGPPLAAAIDFTYNVGHFCSTEMARDFKAGNTLLGCTAFPLYQFRGLKGITNRRVAETRLCLGLKP